MSEQKVENEQRVEVASNPVFKMQDVVVTQKM